MVKTLSPIILWFLLASPPILLAGEPSWWTEQKRACGLRSNLAYNTWVQNGSPCPGQSRPSTPAHDYEAERRRIEDQERQRREEEDRQRQAEERQRKEEEAKQKKWEQERDEAGKTLRGSTGTPFFSGAGELRGSAGMGVTTNELRGSSTGSSTQLPRDALREPGLRDPRSDRVERDLGGRRAAWKQLHCAASILSPALLALRLDDPSRKPDYAEFRYLANEAINALNGQRLGVTCAQAPEFPRLSDGAPDMGRVINIATHTVERAQQLVGKLEEAQRKQQQATEAMSANRSTAGSAPQRSDVDQAGEAQRRINAARDAAGNEMARLQREFNERRKSEDEAKTGLKKIQDTVRKVVEGGELGFDEAPP